MATLTRLLAHPLVFLALLASFTRQSAAQSSPEFRPALLGHHQRSLVNLIDAQSLMNRGQKDAILMFECGITELGDGVSSRTYRESPNSELLRKEVLGRLDQAHFEPAVYKGSHVPVYLHGTVMFLIKDGKPHVRIFLNQSDDDLKSGRDFVEPQIAFVPNNPKYQGIYSPPQAPGRPAIVSLKLSVDVSGHVNSAGVVYENPPGQGFGAQAVGPIRDAIFIPGFRNGKPIPCQFTWTMIFFGPGRQMRTG
jgi:hypothetical protein